MLALLKTALDCGLTTIDTAEIYGLYAVEAALGEALQRDPGVRKKLEIVTKCGIYVPHAGAPQRRTAHYNASARQIVASAEKSLQLLGVEALDLLLVHRPDWLTAASRNGHRLEPVARLRKNPRGRCVELFRVAIRGAEFLHGPAARHQSS